MSKRTPVADWTRNPASVVKHLGELPKSDRASLLSMYTRMSRGEDGGQIEAWSFDSVRSAVYPEWSDADFKQVVETFVPTKPPKELD